MHKISQEIQFIIFVSPMQVGVCIADPTQETIVGVGYNSMPYPDDDSLVWEDDYGKAFSRYIIIILLLG